MYFYWFVFPCARVRNRRRLCIFVDGLEAAKQEENETTIEWTYVEARVWCYPVGLRRFRFWKSSRPPARMISDNLEVEKQKESETTKGTHVRYDERCPWKNSVFFPARPPDFTPRVRRE